MGTCCSGPTSRKALASQDAIAQTTRAEPQDGLDHTWPAAVKLAHGAKLDNADSLAKYRRRGVEDHDRKVALAMAEPTAAPRDDARAPPRRARRRSARKKLDILMR